MTHGISLFNKRQVPVGQACDHRDICTEPAYRYVRDIGYLCKVHFAEFEKRLEYFNGKMDSDMLERLR